MKYYFFSYYFNRGEGEIGFGNGMIPYQKVTVKNIKKFLDEIHEVTHESNPVVITYGEIK